jgi:transcriptional regulator with XRE-family HTH domain
MTVQNQVSFLTAPKVSPPKSSVIGFALMTIAAVVPSTTTGRINALPTYFNGTQSSLTGQMEAIIFASQKEYSIGNSISKMKFVLGLTLEELAQLFNVSRRSIHNWINGEKVNSINEGYVREVSNSISSIAHRLPSANRALLFTAIDQKKKKNLFSLLKDKNFNEFNKVLGRFDLENDYQILNLSSKEKELRTDRPSVSFTSNELSELEIVNKAALHRYKRKKT